MLLACIFAPENVQGSIYLIMALLGVIIVGLLERVDLFKYSGQLVSARSGSFAALYA